MSRTLIPKRRRPFIRAWWRTLLITGSVVVLAALFAIRFFFVEGDSMRRTLREGDLIYVDKLGYGARLPKHPISIPYSRHFYLSAVELPYMRMPGLTGLERQDILVFEDPMGPMDVPVDKREILMRRCVGLPGDTVSIRGASVIVNGELLDRAPGVISYYHLKLESEQPAEFFRRYGIEDRNELSNQGDVVVPLREKEAHRIARDTLVEFVEPWKEQDAGGRAFFPRHPDHPWGPGMVGPLWVPEKGTDVELDTSSLALYERIIEVYEGHELRVEDTTIFIDGEARNSYTFQMDYFYVLGDPRPFSKDSRVWGFLPEDHIIGRALFVLYSYDPKEGGLRWGRTFHWIR